MFYISCITTMAFKKNYFKRSFNSNQSFTSKDHINSSFRNNCKGEINFQPVPRVVQNSKCYSLENNFAEKKCTRHVYYTKKQWSPASTGN